MSGVYELHMRISLYLVRVINLFACQTIAGVAGKQAAYQIIYILTKGKHIVYLPFTLCGYYYMGALCVFHELFNI